MSEEERKRWLKSFCDYAERMGAVFPHGRPDGRPTREQLEASQLDEIRRLGT